MIELQLLFLPILLWFVELVLPFPAVIEEVFKSYFVYKAVSLKQAVKWGLLFGVAEAFLFLVNANQLQSLSQFWWRLALTVPMHGVTSGVFYSFKKRWLVGLLLAIFLHSWFNFYVAG